MSLDAFESLTGIRDFLDRSVLPLLPKSVKSELRAAIKTLENVEAELAVLPELLKEECGELLTLNQLGIAHLQTIQPEADDGILLDGLTKLANTRQKLAARLSEGFWYTTDLIRFHRDIGCLTSAVLENLNQVSRSQASDSKERAALKDLLAQFYLELGSQAKTRHQWQSVFPLL